MKMRVILNLGDIMFLRFGFMLLFAVFLSVLETPAFAELPAFDLSIKDHHFVPETVTIPQGVKVQLRISNQDETAEEFESFELHREKIVPPGETVPVTIGPLDAGSYKFFGDFHQDLAKGVIVSK